MLPKEIYGISTFHLAGMMASYMPLWLADKILVAATTLVIGNTEKYGLKRPKRGPLELKNIEGKTPVLDIGALDKIKAGDIKVINCGIKKFFQQGVELDNGEILQVDAVVMATGYSSNVPTWLKVRDHLILILI